MGERAKIILNEWSAKSMLRRENLDLDKFYTADLKLMVEVAIKEIKEIDRGRLAMAKDLHDRKLEIERLNKRITEVEQENAVLKTQVLNEGKYSYGIR